MSELRFYVRAGGASKCAQQCSSPICSLQQLWWVRAHACALLWVDLLLSVSGCTTDPPSLQSGPPRGGAFREGWDAALFCLFRSRDCPRLASSCLRGGPARGSRVQAGSNLVAPLPPLNTPPPPPCFACFWFCLRPFYASCLLAPPTGPPALPAGRTAVPGRLRVGAGGRQGSRPRRAFPLPGQVHDQLRHRGGGGSRHRGAGGGWWAAWLAAAAAAELLVVVVVVVVVLVGRWCCCWW